MVFFSKKREEDQEKKDRMQQEQIKEKKRKEEMALLTMKLKFLYMIIIYLKFCVFLGKEENQCQRLL